MEERRFQEAVYWACKMDVSAETVMEWQQASHSADRIERIKIGSVEKQELALIERIGGSMRCFTFSALKDTSDGWREIWEDDREGYCMMKCPRIEMNIFGPRLVLEVPKSSVPNCKDIFARKVFIWDGTTFRPAADHAVGGKPHPRTASTRQACRKMRIEVSAMSTIRRRDLLVAGLFAATPLAGLIAQQESGERDDRVAVTHWEELKYPPLAVQARVQGVVVVQVKLDNDGRVLESSAIWGSRLLIPDCLANAKKWQFQPNSQKDVVIVYRFFFDDACRPGPSYSSTFKFEEPNFASIACCLPFIQGAP
jgi:TonB family protein